MSKIFCLIWADLFNFSPQTTPFALVPLWDPFGNIVLFWTMLIYIFAILRYEVLYCDVLAVVLCVLHSFLFFVG